MTNLQVAIEKNNLLQVNKFVACMKLLSALSGKRGFLYSAHDAQQAGKIEGYEIKFKNASKQQHGMFKNQYKKGGVSRFEYYLNLDC